MSGDLEAGGALVTASLVASELDAAKGEHSAEEHAPRRCSNCKAKLAGRYCARCGQAAHVHRSLWHIGEELLHGIFHFDTKSWRTLPLLIARPGLLTRRYIDGQRVRYVSPLALFLFTVFLMFFVVSLLNKDANFLNLGNEKDRAQIRTNLATAISEAERKIAEQETNVKEADDKDRLDATEALAELKSTKSIAEQALTAFDQAAAKHLGETPVQKAPAEAVPAAVAEPAKKKDSKVNIKFHNDVNIDTDADDKWIPESVRHNLANPDLLLYKFKNTAYKYSFMLIPISLPFIWLLFFWRRGINMYDHAIFSLYSLSFMSLYFMAVALMMKNASLKNYVAVSLLVPPVHMFAHLKETYHLRTFSALWRTVALLCICSTVFTIFVLMTVTISVV